ncbi:hypothetical protein HMPREF0776_1222, partial [Staphylococcus aureus subsp. aureus USA300_TCH959]
VPNPFPRSPCQDKAPKTEQHHSIKKPEDPKGLPRAAARGDKMKYRTIAAALVAVCAAGYGGAAAAQWPERPITLIVPFPA